MCSRGPCFLSTKHDMLMELVPFRRCADQTMELHHPLLYDPFDWWTPDEREDRDR